MHQIKIDKSFLTSMDRNENDAAIVRSTIDLARNLGLKVTAEGVETLATWDQLSLLGCDMIQGFYVSRAMAPDQLTPWLKGRARSNGSGVGTWSPGFAGLPVSPPTPRVPTV